MDKGFRGPPNNPLIQFTEESKGTARFFRVVGFLIPNLAFAYLLDSQLNAFGERAVSYLALLLKRFIVWGIVLVTVVVAQFVPSVIDTTLAPPERTPSSQLAHTSSALRFWGSYFDRI